jgi:Elongation factor G C-terminus
MVCLTRLGTATEMPLLDAELSVVTAMLPSAQVRSLQEQIPGLTGGEGVLDASFGGYEPIQGSFPGSAADRRWFAGATVHPWTMPLIREWPQLGARQRTGAGELARLDPLLRFPVILPATFTGCRQPRETNVARQRCWPHLSTIPGDSTEEHSS